jgi:cob(I)alamin adenosyltransferase
MRHLEEKQAMGHRLSRIYTRTGDTGDTGLGDGSRIAKDSLRVDVMGDVDELNSCVGLLLAETVPQPVASALHDLQHALFDLGGEICIPGRKVMDERHAVHLEQLMDGFNADLPPLKEFILPGGTRAAALAHLARTVCRRAERSLVALSRTEAVNPASCVFLNRVSDLFFIISRVLNRTDGASGDVLWQPGKTPG